MPILPSPPETSAYRIALIEDDPVIVGSLQQRLTLDGYQVDWQRAGRDAVTALTIDRPAATICDIRLPDLSGEEVFAALHPHMPEIPFIFVTAYADVDQAVRLVKAGATDFMTKPFEVSHLLERLSHLLPQLSGNGALGNTPVMRSLEATLRRVADLDSILLIGGESGAGKEVAARFAHGISKRAKAPFVAVNCAAIPETLIESELFGHDKGAFTGADRAHEGYLERARDGTIFLDEIGDLPSGTQTRLLRVIEERAFCRLGSGQPTPLRARIICATHVDLPQAIEAGRFRKDLYYRIAVIPLTVPSLRERCTDILPLLNLFVADFAAAFGRDVRGVTPEAERIVGLYDWPGNVRELRNRAERAVALAEGPWITPEALFPDAITPAPLEECLPSLSRVLAEAERRHITKAIAEAGGNVEQAAKLLGVSRSTLFEKLRRQRAWVRISGLSSRMHVRIVGHIVSKLAEVGHSPVA